MNGFLGGVRRWLFVVGFVAVTFWPDFGVAALLYKVFPFAPLPVAAFACAWFVPFCLALPLPLAWFRLASTISIAAIYLAACYFAATVGLDVLGNWLIWLIGAAGLLLGWLTVCTKLWRWARGIVAVQDVEAAE